jgi:hypothetical protein
LHRRRGGEIVGASEEGAEMELTLAALGATALTEGIKFLYGQATEILKRRRERKAGREVEDTVPVEAPEVVAGELRPAKPDWAAVERLEGDIEEQLARLALYKDDIREADPGDEDLLRTTEALRRSLEVILAQRITFKGEEREPSGPIVVGSAEVDDVAGYVAGVRAGEGIAAGEVRGDVKAGRVEQGGQAVGVDAGKIGGR